MLTGLFFLGGLVAFTYLCWWVYDNERHPDGMLPRRGLLAMAMPDELASEAKQKKTPAWRRNKASLGPTSGKAKPTRTPRYRRTGH